MNSVDRLVPGAAGGSWPRQTEQRQRHGNPYQHARHQVRTPSVGRGNARVFWSWQEMLTLNAEIVLLWRSAAGACRPALEASMPGGAGRQNASPIGPAPCRRTLEAEPPHEQRTRNC